jgi:hypothetical protein
MRLHDDPPSPRSGRLPGAPVLFGPPGRFSVQYVPERRPAARAHRQSRTGGDPRRLAEAGQAASCSSWPRVTGHIFNESAEAHEAAGSRSRRRASVGRHGGSRLARSYTCRPDVRAQLERARSPRPPTQSGGSVDQPAHWLPRPRKQALARGDLLERLSALGSVVVAYSGAWTAPICCGRRSAR